MGAGQEGEALGDVRAGVELGEAGALGPGNEFLDFIPNTVEDTGGVKAGDGRITFVAEKAQSGGSSRERIREVAR